ncbi:MAG: hypothetical protein LBN39_02120 [Planctomycetaceae bacterium]|jgi:hypothetical protein|nr:hypothetical protein [Planctomycetaceae bacterium]
MSITGFTPVMPGAVSDAKAHERTAESQERAVQSQGISGDDKESAAASNERDADGRQAWQWNQRRKKPQEPEERQVADITGKTGSTLDLNG